VALIVEDGTGLANAESFISVADATTYHAARGNAAWAALASDTIREQCLRKATDYMEAVYRLRWSGYRTGTIQVLSWPRYAVPRKDYAVFAGHALTSYYASDAVPATVANACAELALRAATGELSPDIERAVSRETIGPITVEYEKGSLQSKRFEAVDNMLMPFFKAVGMFLPVTRV
jgi:hypothetical protein